MARYIMVIDTRRCVGCMDCVVACKTENSVPEGFCRDWITETVQGEYPTLRMEIRTERCNHCANPPCVHCCPTGASHVHERGGVVLVTPAKCIGCKACLAACPYDARFIHPDGYADKCTFCVHRVEQGLAPACVSVCPTHCMHFGDGDDPLSTVNRLLASRSHHTLLPEAGTKPAIFFSYVNLNRLTVMTEFTNFRHNPGVDPALHLWGWEIPVYLFLGGLVAGLMIIAGVRLLVMKPRERQAMVCCTIGPLVGIVLLSVGMLALFLDLTHKAHVWRLYLTFQPTSPMSWGSWILLLVYPALLANALTHLPEAIPALSHRFPVLTRISDFILARSRLVLAIGVGNMLLGVALGIYTGILLSAMASRPLWNSAILGPLFLFSGLSTAAALLHGLLVLSSKNGDRPVFVDFLLSNLARWSRGRAPDASIAPLLQRADNSFLTIELGLLLLLLTGLVTSTEASQRAAQLLLSGSYAAPFWVLVIGLGILLPLVLQYLELQHRIRHSLIPAALVLFGGFVLRVILVSAGQASQLPLALH